MYAYDSWVGTATSYHAVYNTLKKLLQHNLQRVNALATDLESSVFIHLDNIQHFVHPHHYCMGQEAHMLTGTTAIAFKLESFYSVALDLVDKQQCIAENKWQSLTLKDLWGFIDHAHLDLICVIQCLCTLADFVPQLDQYKGDVQKLYSTKGQKHLASLHKMQVHPLPTNGKNETITSDLAKSLWKIYSHIGQTKTSYMPCLILTGGDGLTYEQIVQLKNYLQFHGDTYEWLDILKPLLEIWHTKWTDLS